MEPARLNAALVGLYSPAPQSGKTTLALALGGYGFARVRFAGPLKSMLRTLLLSAGCSTELADRMIEGDLKEKPSPFLAGKTPRWAMQTLGTEWGRSFLGERLWVDAALGAAYQHLRRGTPVVMDDMRYPNEAQAIRDAGGLLVRVVRPGAPGTHAHPSEGALDTWSFDAEVVNDYGTPEAFVAAEAPRICRLANYPPPSHAETRRGHHTPPTHPA